MEVDGESGEGAEEPQDSRREMLEADIERLERLVAEAEDSGNVEDVVEHREELDEAQRALWRLESGN